MLAVLVGLVGVVVVLRPGSAQLGLGHLAALAAAVFGALASVIVRKIGRDERTAVLMLYPMAANFIVMGILLAFVYKPMPVEHLGATAVISLLGFVGGLFLISAYRNGDAAIVAPMQYSQILWATGYGYLLFDESVDRTTADRGRDHHCERRLHRLARGAAGLEIADARCCARGRAARRPPRSGSRPCCAGWRIAIRASNALQRRANRAIPPATVGV